MKIATSNTPKQDVARALCAALAAHKNSDVLLLLAGGSALQILDELDTQHVNEYVTIMMMDERFSHKPSQNNFLEMSRTAFYTISTSQGATIIPSIPENGESLELFANRIGSILTQYVSKKPQAVVLALFGIGPDGHTAGIFPMSGADFVDTYGQGSLYVPVVYTKNIFSERCSITPKFITQYITESFIYAIGNQKLPALTALQLPDKLHVIPARIHTQTKSTLFTDQTV